MRYYCCNNCCCLVVFLVAAVVTGTLPNTSMFCWLPRTRTMCGHVCHGCQHEIYGFSKHLNFVICHTNGLPAWCRWWGWWRCCRRLWHCFTPSPIPKAPLHIAMCTLPLAICTWKRPLEAAKRRQSNGALTFGIAVASAKCWNEIMMPNGITGG